MQWVVYGAGAVGGVLGGLMYDAGHDVELVARGEHLRAINAEGLRLESPEGSLTIPVAAVGSAADVSWAEYNVVLLAVKSHQTVQALADLDEHAPPGVPVVCVQNGVSNEPAVLRFFDHVLGVCVMMPTAHLQPGVVEAHCSPVPGVLDIGRFPSGSDGLARDIAAAFVSAGFVSEPRADIMAWKHRKLLMNLGNAVQACCGKGAASDELRARVRAEGEAALRAAGIPVVSEDTDRERRGDILQVADVGGRPRSGGSSWQSLQRGVGNIESDYLNGEIVLLGRLYDVSTPANDLLRKAAAQMARDRSEPGSADAAALLARLG